VLIHIGDACIRKLHELYIHVDKSENEMVVMPEGCEVVRTVEQMAALIAANRDSHMGEKRLYQGILNMNEVRLLTSLIIALFWIGFDSIHEFTPGIIL
jgi:hypothetical protein